MTIVYIYWWSNYHKSRAWSDRCRFHT